jgi:thiosulfate dehydrogenase
MLIPRTILGLLVWACIEGCIVLLMVTAWPARSDAKAGDRVVPLHAADERNIPEGPVGDAIRYGKKVLTETQRYAPAYVGNGLNCSSCHLEAGRKAWTSPWVGIWGMSPEYRGRNGKINALQERIKATADARRSRLVEA